MPLGDSRESLKECWPQGTQHADSNGQAAQAQGTLLGITSPSSTAFTNVYLGRVRTAHTPPAAS